MNAKVRSEYFVAIQIAGSCRLEGIPVSQADELQMADIIAGRKSAEQLKRELLAKYHAENASTLKVAAS